MNKEQTQTQFEAIMFMHERPQEQQEDYIDTYAEPPRREYRTEECPECVDKAGRQVQLLSDGTCPQCGVNFRGLKWKQ